MGIQKNRIARLRQTRMTCKEILDLLNEIKCENIFVSCEANWLKFFVFPSRCFPFFLEIIIIIIII